MSDLLLPTPYKLSRPSLGDLAGHTFCPIDWERFIDFKTRCYALPVHYKMGAKDPHPGSGQIGFSAIDCSGFVRTLLMYAACGAMDAFPDGSWDQGDWLGKMGFKPTTADVADRKDGHLRCYIHHADEKDETGHILLAINGHSVESNGGHGPNERSLDVKLSSGYTLRQLISVGYVLC